MKRKEKYVKTRNRIGLMLLMMFYVAFAYAQVTVKGTVHDDSGVEVIGANVKLKGTNIGTITDFDGRFVIKVPNMNDAVLMISFIGYENKMVFVKGKTNLNVILTETSNELGEVTVVAYGTQKKETLTGAISSIKTSALLRSPNASIANTLAGQITGLSSVSTSGKPGEEDPSIYVRGVGSLTTGASAPLILVDGVERSFFQMDPNEIESVTVLKDASATAVFGVRGANGVVLVTTRRGVEGKTKISVTSSVGITRPTRVLEMANSNTYAQLHNELRANDNRTPSFDDYALERFRLGDEPLLYPDIDWRRYIMKNTSVQTQHNVNLTGGTERVRYFVSLGFLYQEGLYKQFKELSYNNSDNFTRFNYRTNLDMNVTKTTTLKVSLGGIVGLSHDPSNNGVYGLFEKINSSQPFSSPGVVDGKVIVLPGGKYPGVGSDNGVSSYYNLGYTDKTSNTMNMDLALTQNLDMVTKGLLFEVKGAYNTSYTYQKGRIRTATETYEAYYKSYLEGVHPETDHPLPGDVEYDKTPVYKINMQYVTSQFRIEEKTSRARDWYMEASFRYNRKFGDHNVTGLLLYNQNKKYYPAVFTAIPTAYVGLVGRATYDYKSRYMAEFNFGYNGSENFSPDKRFGAFPAGSIGYIVSEESFMKKQKVVDYLKLRTSVGLVGNDNMSNARFMYLPDGYQVDGQGTLTAWKGYPHGYNFGYNSPTWDLGAFETRLGNPMVTWETALKQNYGLDIHFFKSRLKMSADIFFEDRKDILVSRSTIPVLSSLTSSLLPATNLGRVKNHGYEIEVKWDDRIKDVHYYIDLNMSYAKNKIIYQDEIEPNESYQWRTGRSVGAVFGYVADGFYSSEDFDSKGNLVSGLADPKVVVAPGDVKYKDLNLDGTIDLDDQCEIGYPTRPLYTFGLNYGLDYKGWSFTMNWTGVTDRSLVLEHQFRIPFGKGNGSSQGLMKYHADNRWTPETANTATVPRFSENSLTHNTKQSTLWVKDGSFLKLKTITLGYNFVGVAALKKLGISQLGLKLTGYNLLTFDKFGIMDPESKPSAYDSYPIMKIYSLGVNLTF